MERKIIETEIKELQEIIKEQTDILFSHNGIIPQIEMDIVLENLRKLYTLYNELIRPESGSAAGNKPSVSSETMDRITKKRQDVHHHQKLYPGEEEKNLTEKIPPRPVFDIKTSTEETTAVNNENPAPEIKQDIPDKAEPTESTELDSKKDDKTVDDNVDLFSSNNMTLADKLKTDKDSVYDIIGKEVNKEMLADKLKQNKIADLKSAIGINEKFLLVSELFGGNMHAYDEAIDTLNQFSGFQEASVHLNHLRSKFNMDANSDSYKTLLLFVNKRYL